MERLCENTQKTKQNTQILNFEFEIDLKYSLEIKNSIENFI